MDVNLCKPLKVNRDRGVPVGLFAGADVVVVTYAVAGGVPEPGDLLPIISIKLARILAIISAALFDSEPDVLGGGYRIHGSSAITNLQRCQLTVTASLQNSTQC